MAAVVDPENETFWKQIREAAIMVSAQHERVVEFTVGNRRAHIKMVLEDPPIPRAVSILIFDHDPDQPTLLVP